MHSSFWQLLMPCWRYLCQLNQVLRNLFRCFPTEADLVALLDRMDVLESNTESDSQAIEAARAMVQRSGEAIVRSWNTEGFSNRDNETGSDTLLIAFAGADANPNLQSVIKGGMPSHEFVKAIRLAGISRAIFVRDTLKAWYILGINPSGLESPMREYTLTSEGKLQSTLTREGEPCFESMIRTLQSEIDILKPARVVTLGSSMGGYGALRAGLALNADVAVAFSPQVFIDWEKRKQLFESPTVSWPIFGFEKCLITLKRVASVTGVPLMSLVDAVQAAGSHTKTRLEVHVGSKEPEDIQEARLLKDAVERTQAATGNDLSMDLKVHEGLDHNLVRNLKQTGQLHELLQRFAGPAVVDADGIPEDFVGFKDCGDF